MHQGCQLIQWAKTNDTKLKIYIEFTHWWKHVQTYTEDLYGEGQLLIWVRT